MNPTPSSIKTESAVHRLFHPRAIFIAGSQEKQAGRNPNPRSRRAAETMSYDDVEIEDMEWNDELQSYTYPCPCGDLFQITKDDLRLGEDIARCPSCSLYITVIYNAEDFADTASKKNPEPSKQQPVAVA